MVNKIEKVVSVNIRQARPEDASALVEMHMQNVCQGELSSFLGFPIVNSFYSKVIADENASIQVLECSQKIVAHSIVFFRFSEFEAHFKREICKHLLTHFYLYFWNISKVFGIYKRVFTDRAKKHIPLPIYNNHVGLFILDKNHREKPYLVTQFIDMYRNNINSLKLKANGFWASCRISNKASERLLKSENMIKFKEIESYPENLLLMIRSFSKKVEE